MADSTFAETRERHGVLPVVDALHRQYDGPGVAPPDMSWAERNLVAQGRRRFMSRQEGYAAPYTFYVLLRDWFHLDDMVPDSANVWFPVAMSIQGQPHMVGHSRTKPRLELATVTDARLLPLLDRAPHVIIKSLPIPTSRTREEYTKAVKREGKELTPEEAFVRFAWDVAHAFVLRSLVTDYDLQVTPHFATLLDTVAARDTVDPLGGLRVYSVMERAQATLSQHIRHLLARYPLPAPFSFERHVVSFVFCVLRSIECANRLLGFRHGDLHWENVLVRVVTATPYAGRPWAYRHRRRPNELQIVPPDIHLNAMAEIIDFDTSAVRHYETRFVDGVPDREAEIGFFMDAARFVQWAILLFEMPRYRPAVADPAYGQMVAQLKDLLDMVEREDWEWDSAPLFEGVIQRVSDPQHLLALHPLVVSWMPDSNVPDREPMGWPRKRTMARDEDTEESPAKRTKPMQACAHCGARAHYEDPEFTRYCSPLCQMAERGLLDCVTARLTLQGVAGLR